MNIRLRNKIKGAVYGFAIGDAMGATTEFMSEKEIKKTYGQVKDIIGGGWLGLHPGEITDDTQMTMCVMHAIMKKSKNHDEFQKVCEDNFVHWINTNPKDVGSQCARAIGMIMCGRTAPIDNKALGNGSLMRAMPLAVLDLPFLNIIQGRITHNNRFCSKIIMDYSVLMQGLINDDYRMINKVTNEYKSDDGHLHLCEPTGYVLNTFVNSIFWSGMNTFEEAVIGAVNHGGDADSIAAIAGSLAGAKFGFNNIPERWVETLNPEVKKFLEKFINFAFSYLQI